LSALWSNSNCKNSNLVDHGYFRYSFYIKHFTEKFEEFEESRMLY
jgi:hypothetical protein